MATYPAGREGPWAHPRALRQLPDRSASTGTVVTVTRSLSVITAKNECENSTQIKTPIAEITIDIEWLPILKGREGPWAHP